MNSLKVIFQSYNHKNTLEITSWLYIWHLFRLSPNLVDWNCVTRDPEVFTRGIHVETSIFPVFEEPRQGELQKTEACGLFSFFLCVSRFVVESLSVNLDW